MKVLIVRFAAIGDCVMTAWAVTAVRVAAPHAKITWAVQDKCSPVIDTSQLVDKVLEFPRGRWKKKRWSPNTWREQIVKYTELRSEGFDLGFDFQGHSKTALCLRLAGCKRRLSSRATDALAAALNPPSQLSPDGPHEVELAMALVRLGIDCELPPRPLMPKVSHRVSPLRQSLNLDGEVVTIQTGAGEVDKRYPLESWVEVARQLQSRGLRVVAMGGDGDPKLPNDVAIDCVGKFDLVESLALINSSSVHLAADTGTGHAAAAYGVPVVSIFGRTDPARFRPWTKEGLVLREGRTTNAVHPEQVVESALVLLKESGVASAR